MFFFANAGILSSMPGICHRKSLRRLKTAAGFSSFYTGAEL
jgi:hypothetical protein